ncbi:AAA family ATPase [Candidatus Saccharibacteria bacterium]|nr:AAA family ATPase [Candidatus Saccharibacteria bacterium]
MKLDFSSLKLGEEQAEVYKLLEKTRDNYFITGKAGTGKSVLLQYFVEHTKKQIAIVAPTGIAALNVGGQTIHSFFRLTTDVQDAKDHKKVTSNLDRIKSILRRLDCLVIDEISMVGADIIDMIDAKMRFARGTDQPFGGCQIVAFGDLYQLPPITPKGDALAFIRDRYQTIHFFNAEAILKSPFKVVELTEVFRQTDPVFVDILNQIRLGEVTPDLIRTINENCHVRPQDQQYITLASMNATADSINRLRLSELNTSEFHFKCKVEGEMTAREYPAAETLGLKVGAQVMMTKNDHIDPEEGRLKQRWVNGSLGTISYLDKDEIRVTIDGHEYKVEKERWDKFRYHYNTETGLLEKEPVAGFIQYPIALAYAITIHKSQGQTYDAVKVNLGRGAFATGQTYVAMSRCRSLEGLFFENPLRLSDIRVDPVVVSFMDRFRVE